MDDKFVIRKNKYLADGINFITKINYIYYTNNKNELMFEFPKDNKIIEAYNIMLELRRKFNS